MDIDDIKTAMWFVLLVAMAVSAAILLAVAIDALTKSPSDYDRARAVFTDCVEDDTFTRSECLTLAGMEAGRARNR